MPIREMLDILLAHIGLASAQIRLAHRLLRQGIPPAGIDEAIYWARRASNGGSREGAVFLGSMFLTRNAAGDSRRAFDAYRIAANSGSGAGMQCLGWCYEQGSGVEKDESEAWKWYRAAADSGRTECQIAVAEMLIRSNQEDAVIQAKRYAEMASRGGVVRANALLDEINRIINARSQSRNQDT